VHARALERALMTRKSCAVGMRNATLRNQPKCSAKSNHFDGILVIYQRFLSFSVQIINTLYKLKQYRFTKWPFQA